jgi:hypothetical protein
MESLDVVKYSTLASGIIWYENNPKKYLTQPLSTIFNGVVYGSICSLGATFISKSLPDKGKYLLSGIIGLSGIYYLGKGFYNSYYGIETNENIRNNDIFIGFHHRIHSK